MKNKELLIELSAKNKVEYMLIENLLKVKSISSIDILEIANINNNIINLLVKLQIEKQ